MKHVFLTFILLAICCTISRAQIAYSYDPAGNRISRQPVLQQGQPVIDEEALCYETVSISVSPNPTSGPCTLVVHGMEQPGTFPVTITDAYGTPLVNVMGSSLATPLDISALHSGYYLVFATLNGKQYCCKIVKQ